MITRGTMRAESSLCFRNVAGLVLLSLLSVSVLAEDARNVASDEIERFPIACLEPICVPIEIYGERRLAVLDTGTTYSVLDEEFRNRLGAALQQKSAETATSRLAVSFYASPVITIGPESRLTLDGIGMVGCTDFSAIRSVTGQLIVGVIGMDELIHRVIRMNYDDTYVAFVRSVRDTPAHVEKITIDTAKPRVQWIRVRISDEGFHRIVVDTGKTGAVSLESSLFSKLLRKKRIALDGDSERTGIAGTARSRCGIIDSIEVGPYRITNVSVNEASYNILGLRVLQCFETEFDFPNHKAYFRPGKRLREPQPRNLAGLQVKRREKEIAAFDVHGVAESAGVQNDDVILRVNGKPAVELTLMKIRELIYQPDSELKLTLQRDDKTWDVTLLLKRQPDPFPNDDPAPIDTSFDK